MNTEDRQEQLDRINTEIARLAAERDGLADQFTAAMADVATHAENAKHWMDHCKQWEAINKDDQKTIAALTAERDKYKLQSEIGWASDAEMVKKYEALEKQHYANLRKLHDMTAERDALMTALRTSAQEYDERIDVLEGQIELDDNTIKNLTAERDALADERDDIMLKRDEYHSERDLIRAERDAISRQLESDRDALAARVQKGGVEINFNHDETVTWLLKRCGVVSEDGCTTVNFMDQEGDLAAFVSYLTKHATVVVPEASEQKGGVEFDVADNDFWLWMKNNIYRSISNKESRQIKDYLAEHATFVRPEASEQPVPEGETMTREELAWELHSAWQRGYHRGEELDRMKPFSEWPNKDKKAYLVEVDRVISLYGGLPGAPHALPKGLPTYSDFQQFFERQDRALFEPDVVEIIFQFFAPYLHEPTSVMLDVTAEEMAKTAACIYHEYKDADLCWKDCHDTPRHLWVAAMQAVIDICNSRLRAQYGRKFPEGVTFDRLINIYEHSIESRRDTLRAVLKAAGITLEDEG